MSKSLIDVLWKEVKRSFYLEHINLSEKAVDIAWMEYQLRIIKESQGVKS